nr:DUF4209 domain-containing protein [Aquitalea magnusonii]
MSVNDVFVESISPIGSRIVRPSDFSTEDFHLFQTVATSASNPYLKARLHDILWSTREPRDIKDAWSAIDSYLQIPLNSDAWREDGFMCWQRAVKLGLGPGRGKNGLVEVLEQKLSLAFQSATPSDWFVARDLAELLGYFSLDINSKKSIAEKLESLANSFDDGQSPVAPMIAGMLYAKSETWFTKIKESTRAATVTAKRAETYVCEAKMRLASPHPSHAVAAGFYERAIQTYRSIPRGERARFSGDERIAELRTMMGAASKYAVGEMRKIGGESIELSDEICAAQNIIRGKCAVEGMLTFINLVPQADEIKLREQILEQLRQPFLLHTIPRTLVNKDGRVQAKLSGLDTRVDPSESCNNGIVHHEVLRAYRFERSFYVVSMILPALEILYAEHQLTEADFVEIVSQSPIVPAGRVRVFAMALYSGFKHDFVTALHILAPQLEYLVRYQLKLRGALTTNLDSSGEETENSLNTLLKLPEIASVFSGNHLFELQALFADPWGCNFRNHIAHGLLDEDECQSAEAVYAWWFCLRLILRPI